jgi:uncharacterized membrane protein
MKKVVLGLLSIAAAFLGLAAFLNLLYNLCGLLGGRDRASGPAWQSALVALVCAVVAFGAFFLSYRLLRSAAFRKDPN